MKTKNHKLFLITGVIISGFIIFAYTTVNDKWEIGLQIEENEMPVSKDYNAASVSEGTVLLLLAVGVIGALVISRKKKEIPSASQRNENSAGSENQNLNEDRPEF